jgi:hypothetical protein
MGARRVAHIGPGRRFNQENPGFLPVIEGSAGKVLPLESIHFREETLCLGGACFSLPLVSCARAAR